jgi:hypothetical protein
MILHHEGVSGGMSYDREALCSDSNPIATGAEGKVDIRFGVEVEKVESTSLTGTEVKKVIARNEKTISVKCTPMNLCSSLVTF